MQFLPSGDLAKRRGYRVQQAIEVMQLSTRAYKRLRIHQKILTRPPVVFMLRDARGTGARGVIARGDGRPPTPRAPVPRASRNMKTIGDESAIDLFVLLSVGLICFCIWCK